MIVDLCKTRSKYTLAILLIAIALLFQTGCGPDGSEKNAESAKPTAGNIPDSKARGAQLVTDFHKADGAMYSKARLKMTVVTANEPTVIYEADVIRKQVPEERIT